MPWTGPAPTGTESGSTVGTDVTAPESLVHEGRDGIVEPVALYRRFVEELLSERPDVGGPDAVGLVDKAIDWHAIWASGEGAATPEQAIGRVVLAAQRAASGRRVPMRAKVVGSSPTTGAARGATGTEVVGRPVWSPEDEAFPTATAQRLVSVPPFVPVPRSRPLDDDPSVPEPAVRRVARPEDEPAATVALQAVRGAQRLRRRQKLANAFGWVRNIGIVIILFAAWQVWGTSIAQHQAQGTLRAQFRAHAKSTPPTSGGVRLLSADVRVPEPREGSVVAHLQIPSIGVDQYVVEGTAEGDLAMGPGHYVGTAMPGQAGNVAIAGHRTTYGAPFDQLNELAPGDPITLTIDSGETLDYVVIRPPVAVSPSDVAVLNGFGDDRLTLTTCNPKFSAAQRLVVVALLRNPSGTGTVATASAGPGASRGASRVSGGGSVGWNLLYLPPVLLVLAVLVLLGFANERASAYYGRRGRWLILVPIWVAGVYVLFGLLTSFVPATL